MIYCGLYYSSSALHNFLLLWVHTNAPNWYFHPQYRVRFNQLSPTYFMISHVYVENNLIVKIYGTKKCLQINKLWEYQAITSRSSRGGVPYILVDWMGGWVGTLYIFIYIHICEGLIFQFPSSHVYSRGVSKFIDRTMSVSHYDLECPFFKHVWFGHGSGFYQHY